MLRRDPVGGGRPKLSHLPGNVDPHELVDAKAVDRTSEIETMTPDQKRKLAAQLLRRKPDLLVAQKTESPS